MFLVDRSGEFAHSLHSNLVVARLIRIANNGEDARPRFLYIFRETQIGQTVGFACRKFAVLMAAAVKRQLGANAWRLLPQKRGT